MASRTPSPEVLAWRCAKTMRSGRSEHRIHEMLPVQLANMLSKLCRWHQAVGLCPRPDDPRLQVQARTRFHWARYHPWARVSRRQAPWADGRGEGQDAQGRGEGAGGKSGSSLRVASLLGCTLTCRIFEGARNRIEPHSSSKIYCATCYLPFNSAAGDLLLQILLVEPEKRAIVVKGSVPGKPGNVVEITPAKIVGVNI